MTSSLNSAAAKAEMKKALKVGTTSAISAKTPAKKPAALAKSLSKAEKANAKWERPNLNALCRKLAGSDIKAGLFLFHILYLWRNRKHKLQRHSKDWLAHKREAWAAASGLTFDEFTKAALPRVRKNCSEFLEIRAMGNGSNKGLWVHVDESALKETINSNNEIPWDLFYAALNGVGPGNEKKPANAYKEDF
ncbi:hypothetical protein [Sulfitobacter pontiacus]|jgi:hypothetical protein|uniref:hypothetical protein n=1 Tax=Sulfitobacter pontiacus TaxID=60137 RepID=UPI0030EF4077|tara:strand:- start:2010 stop:2585 length:576 start_codon:yes stop_codon:yes gene_type:complete